MKNMKSKTFYFLLNVALFTSLAGNAFCATSQNQVFISPEEAAKALQQAVSSTNDSDLKKIFGNDFLSEISSGDSIADKRSKERFAYLLQERLSIADASEGNKIIEAGKIAWPFPVPLIKVDKGWQFDSENGVQEVLNRRIGQNELRAINAVKFYVDAQRLYYSKDRDADGFVEYAQRFVSSPKSRNGLFWEQEPGSAPSPFDSLVRQAIDEGYQVKGTADVPVYHGYAYKILNAQGEASSGGKKNYINEQGRMTEGFALLVYPIRWGTSGIMSFIVSADGIVYEKNLGAKTAAAAAAVKAYNPDASWKKVEE